MDIKEWDAVLTWINISSWILMFLVAASAFCYVKLWPRRVPSVSTRFIRYAALMICLAAIMRVAYLMIWTTYGDTSRTWKEIFSFLRMFESCLTDIALFWYGMTLLRTS